MCKGWLTLMDNEHQSLRTKKAYAHFGHRLFHI